MHGTTIQLGRQVLLSSQSICWLLSENEVLSILFLSALRYGMFTCSTAVIFVGFSWVFTCKGEVMYERRRS